MSRHFGVRHKLVSPVLWDTFTHEGELHGFIVKPVNFYLNGELIVDRYQEDFGHVTKEDGNNLFTTQEEAARVAQLVSEGSEDATETFLVMKVTSNEKCVDVRMEPCGPMFACGRRLSCDEEAPRGFNEPRCDLRNLLPGRGGMPPTRDTLAAKTLSVAVVNAVQAYQSALIEHERLTVLYDHTTNRERVLSQQGGLRDSSRAGDAMNQAGGVVSETLRALRDTLIKVST